MEQQEEQKINSKYALLVEDDEACQIIMTHSLQELNYKVDLVDEGKEAVKMTQDKLYDLIISDIRNKGLSGKEVIPLIRETKNLGTLIFVWSAFVNKKNEPVYLSWGADAALTKPSTTGELKITIDECLKRQRKERESRHRIKKIKKKWQDGGGRINLFEELFYLPNSQLWILVDVLESIMEYKQWDDLSRSAPEKLSTSPVITENPNL